ncbi:hypothetical protein LSCM1_06684 [Leishmania martiniquensis]|uniref:Uncharacterized protein n=1 Tax=Leishmania martiniquensis TaxID=1580590 RepID=A0A836KML5_9TRYP|nr:hypothetical protein LSCM1_06684 [Leishmania martiniquensis]
MSSFYGLQSPLRTSTTGTNRAALETSSPFSNSIEAIRARLHDVVRNIDDVIGADKRVPSPNARTYAAAGTAALSPRASHWGFKDRVEGLQLHGSPTSRAAAVALRRAGPRSVAPSTADLGVSSICRPSSTPHSARVGNLLPTPDPSVPTPVTASYSRERTSSASATTESETAFSATYAATLDFWRVDGRRTFRSTPTGKPGRTSTPAATAAPALTASSTPSAAPATGIRSAQATPLITLAPPPPLCTQRQGTPLTDNFAKKAHIDRDVLAGNSISQAQLPNTSLVTPGTSTAQADSATLLHAPRWPPCEALPLSPFTAARPPMASSSSTSDMNCIRREAPARALVDDAPLSTGVSVTLPTPSSVTTLSARLAALRAADMTQGTSLLKQNREQGRPHDEEKHLHLGASALAAQDSAPLANFGVSKRRDDVLGASDCVFMNDASVWSQRSRAGAQRLQQSSAVADSSDTHAVSDHDYLVRSPPSKCAALPAAKARHAQRASRQGETSLIVSLAQQAQSAREEVWRDAQETVAFAPPVRPPPPLPPPHTSGESKASYTPPSRSTEHHGGRIGGISVFAPASATDKRAAAASAAASASSRSLAVSTTPLDALQERLSPPALALATTGGGAVENHSLSMQEELAMRERLAARRQQQREKALSMRDRATEDQRQRYERLSEARDRDVAQHICGEVARQMAVQVAAQARVEQVRVALPDQPEAVTSEELTSIRLHAQQLERLRGQMHLVVGRPPSYHARATSASTVHEASSTNSSTLSIPPIATGKSCSTTALQREDVEEGFATAARQTRPTAGEEGDACNPSERVAATASSMRTDDRDAKVGVSSLGGGRRGAGTPSASIQSTASAERETTPEQAVESRAPPPSSSQGRAQGQTAEPSPQTAAQHGRRSERVAGEATHERAEEWTGGSLSEDWLTSTQLPPRSSAAPGQAGLPVKVSSPSPVQLQRGASSASHTDGVDTGKLAQGALAQPSVPSAVNAVPSPAQPRHAAAVSADDDAERDLISSNPSGDYSERDWRGAGLVTPERLASIQSTRLHVSPSRGTAWQDNTVASDSASSSDSWLPEPAPSLRDAQCPSRSKCGSRPVASQARSPPLRHRVNPSISASSQRSATPGAHGAHTMRTASTGSSALTSPRATASLPLLSKGLDPLQAHRRAVQREVDKRTALRAQALLSEHGVTVEVQLAGSRVPALVKLSRDGKELLFHLSRIAQVSPRPPRASSTPSLCTSLVKSPAPSLSPAAVASHLPKPRSTPVTMSRVAHLPASSPPAAAVAQRSQFRPPLIPGAMVPIAPSRQPSKVLVKMPPAGTLVKHKVIVGRGGRAVGAPPLGFMRAYPPAQQQRSVAAAPPQGGGALPLPSPSAAASTRPIHVRELHHFPCAYSRVYVPFSVVGYESDLGLGGPRTWEDVGGVLCGPASFEVLRRYRCPLFAEVRGPLWAPYRIYLIIPEFKRIDVPQDAVLLVLDFRQRVDWVLFLLAMQHDVVDRGDSDGGSDDAFAHPPSRSGGAVRSPVLSYGRALWMLAVQRLQRARALRGMNPFDFDQLWYADHSDQGESRGANRDSRVGTPTTRLSSLAKGAVHPLPGGSTARRRFAAPPLAGSGHGDGAGPKVRLSSTECASAPSRGISGSPALHRDPGVDVRWAVSSTAERAARASDRRSGFRFWNARQHASPARSQASFTPPEAPSAAPMTAQETSKPRFQLLKRVPRSLGASRSSRGD